MISLLDGYTPSDLGLSGYAEYRRHPITNHPVQLEVIETAVRSKARVVGLCVPTGVGKSLIAMSVAKFLERRTAILTATLGLENQYMRDMAAYGLVNVHGKGNYECTHNPLKREVLEFDCKTGPAAGCTSVRGKGCTYEIARDESREAGEVITNYDYWFNINAAGGIQRQGKAAEMEGPNPIEILICDEGHEADKKLSNFLSVKIFQKDIAASVDPKMFGEDIGEWRKLAKQRKDELTEEIEGLGIELQNDDEKEKKKAIKEYHHATKLLQKFERITTIDEDWVVEKRSHVEWGRSWSFDVSWPGRYAEQYLHCGIPKVIYMSATLRPHHMRRNGVKKENYEFYEWEPIFQKSNCPLYYLPARTSEGKEIRITTKTSEGNKRVWVEHIDSLCEQRLDRRILILTSSYEYQQYFVEHSRLSKYMIANNSNDPDTPTAQIAYEKFIKAPPPVILCSPSFGTGWDLKDDRCRFLVISKVPLKPPPNTSKLAAKRFEQDKEYFDSETMAEVVQAKGRPQRSEDDWAEVVIGDGTWGWWGWSRKHLAPTGFVDGVRKVGELPKRALK